MKRVIAWIDYAKVFAIFFVVVIHTHCDAELTKALKAFTMPLFFIISGYLFSYENNPEAGSFIKKRARQILVPYLWIGVVAYIAWVLVLRHYGSDGMDGIEWYKPLVGMAAGISPWLVHDIPLYSLVSFFIAEAVYYPLGRMVKQPWTIALASFIVLYILTCLLGTSVGMLPLVLGPSIAGIGFYSLGRQWHKMSDKMKGGWAEGRIFLSLSAVISAMVFLFAYRDNEQVSFYVMDYGNMLLFIIAAVSGAWFTIGLSKLLSMAFGDRKLIRFISVGTLLICGFHLLVFAFIKGFALYVFGMNPEILTEGLVNGLLFSLITMALCLPIIYIIRRYLRFLVDK